MLVIIIQWHHNTLEQPNANHQQETLILPPLNMSDLDHQLNQEPNFLTAKDLEFSGLLTVSFYP